MRVEWHGDKVTKEMIRASDKAAAKGAKLVAEEAKRTTLFRDKSGDLRASIHYVKTRKGKWRTKTWMAIAGDAKAWYGPKVELGHKGVPGKHFMTAAKKKKTRAVKQLFKKEFNAAKMT